MATLKVLINFTGAAHGERDIRLRRMSPGPVWHNGRGRTVWYTPTGDGTVFEIPYIEGSYAARRQRSSTLTAPTVQAPQAAHRQRRWRFVQHDMDVVNDDGTVFELPYTDGRYTSTPTTLADFNGTQTDSVYFVNAAGGDLRRYLSVGRTATARCSRFHTPMAATPAPTTLVDNGGDGANPDCVLIADAAGDLFGTAIQQAGRTGTARYGSFPTQTAATPHRRRWSLRWHDKERETIWRLIADLRGLLWHDLFGRAGWRWHGVRDRQDLPTATPARRPHLVSFNGTNGQNPQGGLILNAAGDLFGTTSGWDERIWRQVFEIVQNLPSGYASAPTTLVSFNGTNGGQPVGRFDLRRCRRLVRHGGRWHARQRHRVRDHRQRVCHLLPRRHADRHAGRRRRRGAPCGRRHGGDGDRRERGASPGSAWDACWRRADGATRRRR